MPTHDFYTRSPELADLKRLVKENTRGEFRFAFKALFRAVDAYCSEHYPSEDRGGWFSPRVVGGSPVSHTPPQVVFAIYAIYMHLAHGDVEPVPFLAGPLNRKGATAVTLEAADNPFLVLDRTGMPHPMTDFLVIIPTSTPVTWTQDTYGLPPFREDVAVIGWHAASQPGLTALNTAQFLLHLPSNQILDPLGTFTEQEMELFFAEPVIDSRLERYRERLFEIFGIPIEVMMRNSAMALRILGEYRTLGFF